MGHRLGDHDAVNHTVDRLTSMPRGQTALAIQRHLELQISHLWTGGWQPADIVRTVGRDLDRPEVDIVVCAIAADAARYERLGRRVAPHWMSQVDSVGATRWWKPGRPYLTQLAPAWNVVVMASVRLFDLLGAIPELQMLVPPPSKWTDTMDHLAPSHLPAGLLDKVRALLAKAESTTFDAEAESFTAKAQEIMARHRIDRAVINSTQRDESEVPVSRRLTIDDPYSEAKVVLLTEICDANGARTVWAKPLGFSTVIAFADDLDAIEELFTSLLVQATAALQREGSKKDRLGRSRTTRFRRSFLVAFAGRIGERLHEAVDSALGDAQAESDDALLPILVARADDVHHTADALFPELSQLTTTASDAEGRFAGRLFADQADVGLGEKLEQRVA